MTLDYTLGRKVTLAQFRGVLERSGLAERRPMHDAECLQGMLDHANLIATCWAGDELVGIARSVSDHHYCCYLSDLAVDRAFQGQGIGTQLVELTRSALGPNGSLILLSAPAAVDFYPKIGFEAHPSAWVRKPEVRDQKSEVGGRKSETKN